jgi:hypothetical protein
MDPAGGPKTYCCLHVLAIKCRDSHCNNSRSIVLYHSSCSGYIYPVGSRAIIPCHISPDGLSWGNCIMVLKCRFTYHITHDFAEESSRVSLSRRRRSWFLSRARPLTIIFTTTYTMHQETNYDALFEMKTVYSVRLHRTFTDMTIF